MTSLRSGMINVLRRLRFGVVDLSSFLRGLFEVAAVRNCDCNIGR